MDESATEPETLGEILARHRVERLGPWAVKCHVCDDWTEGTIHDHHADLATAFLLDPIRAMFAADGAFAPCGERTHVECEVARAVLDRLPAAPEVEVFDGTPSEMLGVPDPADDARYQKTLDQIEDAKRG